MAFQNRLKLRLGVLLALIISIVPTISISQANSTSRPRMTHDFSDVPIAGKEWMEPYINSFFHMGITTGCDDSPLMYCPEAPVTRAAMAVFLGRALGYHDAETAGYTTRAYFKQTGTGIDAHGVMGESASVFGAGVHGSGAGFGVYGLSDMGWGVYGVSTEGTGVMGHSTDSYGVLGTTQEGFAVAGQSVHDYGVWASSILGTALFADESRSQPTDSYYDMELGGSLGEVFANVMLFLSNGSFTVDLDNNSNGDDAFIIRNGADSSVFTVDEGGNTRVTGSKSAIVDTVSYGTRAMYAVEATEVLFEDVGSAELIDGEAVIEIDPMFAETVNLSEEYHVFTEPVGGWADLYIAQMTATSFTVRSADGSDVQFSYRIVAKRLGYEDVRMEEVTP